jgi:hypothetical protein
MICDSKRYQREVGYTYPAEGEERMSVETRTVVAPCPDCGRLVDLGARPREGQRLSCSRCRNHLEIINLEPPELDWAFDNLPPGWESDDEEWDDERDEGERDADDEGSNY